MLVTGALDEVLADEVRRRGILGAAAEVFVGDAPTWSGAAGFADRSRAHAMQPGAIFPIYSITKTFTSVCALRLAEARALALDVSIDRWLPDLPFAERVTLRQLLSHTAGVFNYSALPAYHEDVVAHPKQPWSFAEFVWRTCERPLDFEPGQGFGYSNTGYTLAKRILEIVSGLSFRALIEREVVGPLELRDTFVLEELSDLDRVVPGYSKLFCEAGAPAADVRPLYHPGWCGTGLLASSARDVCRFYRTLLGGALLAPSSRTEMLECLAVPGVYPPAVKPCYGLGIMSDPESALGPEYGHGGGGPGWNGRATHWPLVHGRPVTVTVLCNGDEDHALSIAAALGVAIEPALADPSSR